MNMMASDFSHGWTSVETHRFFRIEANMGLTQDSYTFSIDGIRFIDMQKKPVGGFKRGENNSRYGAGEAAASSSSTTRRASTGAISNTAPATKSPPETKQVKSVPSGNNFDPFSDNHAPSSSFDPFVESPSSANNNPKSTAAANLFDTTQPANSNSNFDPFSSSHDPFAQPAAATKPKAGNDGFGSVDPFSSPSSNQSSTGFSNFPAPAAQPTKSQTTSPANNNDLFGFDNQPSTTTTSKPQRRASAQEISMDFAGLSFAEPAKAHQPAPVIALPQPVVEQPVETKVAAPVDPWATNLVDLDLSGRTAANQRRQSTSASTGPTLDNLMGGSIGGPQRRTSMMGANNLSNNDILSSFQGNNNNDPFGAPNGVMRPAPTPISAMGGMQPQVGPNGYATVPMPPQQNIRGSINMGQPMMMQPPAQGPMMGGGMPMNTRASFTSNVPLTNSMGYAAQPQPPKSSLDSLDWRM